MARRPKKPAAQIEEFTFWVRRPSQSYSFALSHDQWVDDPYRESQSLTLLADCLYPNRFRGREASVLLIASDELQAGSAVRAKCPTEAIKAVGALRHGKDRLEISGFFPALAVWHLGSAIQSGLITSLSVSGTRLKRGHIYLSYISFNGPDHDPLEHIG